MKWERMVLLVFFGNYLINEVAAGLSAFVPAGDDGSSWGPYVTFVILAAVLAGALTWWYMRGSSRVGALRTGVTLGITGAVVSILTTFVSGIFGTIFDTGSLSAMVGILPNFFPYLWDVSTLVLIGYWVVPAAAIGWWLEKGFRAPGTV